MSFIQVQKARSRKDGHSLTYITLATSVREEGRKYSRQLRKYLGVLMADGETVKLSKAYAGSSGASVKLDDLRAREDNEVKLLEWMQEQVDAQRKETRREIAPATNTERPIAVENVGQSYVLGTIAESMGLTACLKSAFGERNGLALLLLAEHQVAEGRPLYVAQSWMEETRIPEVLRDFHFDSSTLTEFMNTTGRESGRTEAFFRLWVERCGKPSSLIFDTTSISTYGRMLQAEWGYNRDGDSLPQVNFALVSGRELGLPLFYRLVPGSIPDVKLVQHTVQRMADFGLKDFRCSLDRGFYSAGNIRTMLEDKTGFVLGAPMSCHQTQELIKKHKNAMTSPKASIMFQGNVVRHAGDTWIVDMGKGVKREIAAHVYMDPKRRADAVASVERIVFELEKKLGDEIHDGRVASLAEGKEWINEKAGLLKNCLTVEQGADGTLSVSRCLHSIATITSKKGYFVVITDDLHYSGENVLADYRSRDSIEKLFDILKNETEQNRVRSGKEHVGAGRLFLAFLGMILHREMENRLRQAKLLKHYSVSEVLCDMRKLKAVKTTAGRTLQMEITKHQRKLFEALKMPEPA